MHARMPHTRHMRNSTTHPRLHFFASVTRPNQLYQLAQRVPISRPLEAQAEVGAAEASHVQIRPPVRTLLPSRVVFHTLHTVVGLLQNAACVDRARKHHWGAESPGSA